MTGRPVLEEAKSTALTYRPALCGFEFNVDLDRGKSAGKLAGGPEIPGLMIQRPLQHAIGMM